VYDDEGWYATYPVVFGSRSLDDKMIEGDRRTPEGTFHILDKRPHSKWHKIMMIDYRIKRAGINLTAARPRVLFQKCKDWRWYRYSWYLAE
jgi:hypothetical protein